MTLKSTELHMADLLASTSMAPADAAAMVDSARRPGHWTTLCPALTISSKKTSSPTPGSVMSLGNQEVQTAVGQLKVEGYMQTAPIVPPAIAIKEFTATRPLILSIDCASA